MSETPYRYTAELAGQIETAWQDRWDAEGTFHTLRHRYGTLAYQATRDLLAVGRQMGHSSPVTTSIYAAPADDAADVIADAVAR